MKKFFPQFFCIVILTALCSVTLTAQQQYSVTVSSANPPLHGIVAPFGITIMHEGEPMFIFATPGGGYKFINWMENDEEFSTTPKHNFIVTRDYNLVAHFAPSTYDITVSANPEGYGTVSGGGAYMYGNPVTVSAVANPDYLFINWTEEDNVVSTTANYTFPAQAHRNLVANFVPATCNITLSQNIENGGTVNGAGNYPYGQTVIVHATSNVPEFMFSNWTEDGNIVSTKFIYSFTATQPRHLVANFSPAVYHIPVYANPGEGGTVSGGGEYTYGDLVTLSAVPKSDFQFLNWTKFTSGNGTVVSTEPNYSYDVIGNWGNTAFVAYFTKDVEVHILINVPGGEVLGGGSYKYGDEVIVEAIPQSGYKFVSWSAGRGIISTDNPYTFTVTESMVLLANFEEDGEVNIETINTETISIHPNPAKGELIVTSNELPITNIEIFDVLGNKVLSHISNHLHQTSINISDIPAGTYFIQLKTEKGIVTKKFVKN